MKCNRCGGTKTQVINGKIVCWKCGEVLGHAGQDKG